MNRSFFRVMLVRSHAEGATRNQEHPMMMRLFCSAIGCTVIELNRAHIAIPTGLKRLMGLNRLLFARSNGPTGCCPLCLRSCCQTLFGSLKTNFPGCGAAKE